MAFAQSNRDSLCSNADSDCSALSVASDSAAVQLRHSHHQHQLSGHSQDSAAVPAIHRHSLTSVSLRECERERERDAFLFQPIAIAGHLLAETGADTASESDIPQHSLQSAAGIGIDVNARPQPDAVAAAGNSTTSTPFSGYYSASSSLSLPSLVSAAVLRQQAAASQSQVQPMPPSHSSELGSVMSSSTSSAQHAASAHSLATGMGMGVGVSVPVGASASADVLLIRPTPIKLAAAQVHTSDAVSVQSLANAATNAMVPGGAFTQVTTLYERELCNLMQRTAIDQLSNSNRFSHGLSQSGRAIARVRRSRTPSQPTNTSPPRCSSQPSEAQPALPMSTSSVSANIGCVCARSGVGVIEFSDGACCACAIAAARAASRKRRWRRRAADNTSFDGEAGSYTEGSHLRSSSAASQADTDSPPSDYDDRDELDVVSCSSVTDSPARCDSKCRRRFVATGDDSRPSINAEKMLTVVSLSDLQQSSSSADATRFTRCSAESDAHPTRRERSRHSHSRRPTSQILESRRGAAAPFAAFAPTAGVGVQPSFSMMENQLAAVCALDRNPPRFSLGAPLTPTQFAAASASQSADELSDSPNSDDDELLEAAAACVGVGIAPARFTSIPDRPASAQTDAHEPIMYELDIEQIENN